MHVTWCIDTFFFFSFFQKFLLINVTFFVSRLYINIFAFYVFYIIHTHCRPFFHLGVSCHLCLLVNFREQNIFCKQKCPCSFLQSPNKCAHLPDVYIWSLRKIYLVVGGGEEICLDLINYHIPFLMKKLR